ncbi:MAG: 16S rRNA (adenine(1518)-N(6)/adenine(1519)-N(6))-dimethyltransferase RsmA [Gammaproteobacteria bacterium]
MTHQARKRFGQNFLHDPNIINRIIQCVAPRAEDQMIEIGPGQGAITVPLLAAAGKLQVIELDRDLIKPLQHTCDHNDALQIFNQDALAFDFRQLFQSKLLRIVGNLPYNISTPLLFHLISQASVIKDMHFMLQKEVVTRLAAPPETRNYGRLSVMIQYYCEVIPLFSIGPGAFNPPPKVDSGFVRLIPHSKPPVHVVNIKTFEQLVKQSFAQRRKTLHNNLRGVLEDAQIISAGVNPSARAETLSLSDFAALANQVQEENS